MTNFPEAIVHQLRSGDVILGVVLLLVVSCIAAACAVPFLHGRPRSAVLGFTGFAWQLGALLGLEQAYEFTRGRIPHESDIAMLNAYRLLDFEWKHGFFVESRVERFFLQFQWLMNAVDMFYVLAHVGVTLTVLGWIYIWHRDKYPFMRNLIMLTTAIALIAFYVYPTAPPRMLGNYGFVDPLQVHGIVSAGGEQPDSYTYNPYAAMPSLHVGYALVVAWGILISTRHLLLRVLAMVYPVFMSAAVVISGNHWLLDIAGAAVTVAVSGVALLSVQVLLASLRRRLVPLVRRYAYVWVAEEQAA